MQQQTTKRVYRACVRLHRANSLNTLLIELQISYSALQMWLAAGVYTQFCLAIKGAG